MAKKPKDENFEHKNGDDFECLEKAFQKKEERGGVEMTKGEKELNVQRSFEFFNLIDKDRN